MSAFVNLFADLVEPSVIADGGPGALDAWEADALLVDAPPERTEVPAQYGPVLEVAAEHGIACPGIEAVLAMIGELERGRERRRDNLVELDEAMRKGRNGS